jgi:hypothetical protein
MGHYWERYEKYKCDHCKKENLNYEQMNLYIFDYEIKKYPILKNYQEMRTSDDLHLCKECYERITGKKVK